MTYLILYHNIFTLKWSKVVFYFQANKLGSIPCPFLLWSGGNSHDWAEEIGGWNFPQGIVCLETILGHLEIKLDLKSDPQYNTSHDHAPFYPKYGQNQFPRGSRLVT